MTVVRLIHDDANWDVRDLTPGRTGNWEGIQFTADPIAAADYAVLLFNTREGVHVTCPGDKLWAIVGEPPNEYFAGVIRRMKGYARIYSADDTLTCAPWIPSHPALGWQVRKSYDELRTDTPPEKARPLSWITSDIAAFEAHRARLRFLARIRGRVPFDLFGRGFAPVADKWDALAPYRYSIVVENHSGPYYWSEKLADALLAWTMPIYHGCTRLPDFFPRDAVIPIDIEDPDAAERIKEAICGDTWIRRRDAIAEARRLILDRYQPIAFLAEEIRRFEKRPAASTPAKRHVVAPLPRPGIGWRLRARARRVLR
jgi:hypothetical protein